MTSWSEKLFISGETLLDHQRHAAAPVDSFLNTAPKNVIGAGYGVKWINGEPTGEPALLVFVTKKFAKAELRSADLVPGTIGQMQTDVVAVGEPFAGIELEMSDRAAAALSASRRPVLGGYSVGHVDVTAGTIGTCVYDIAGTPGNPVGIPEHFYILSANHVLANRNEAHPGDPVLQPGPFDGGKEPEDRIALLSRFVPITFDPPTPLALHRNLIDAAIAEAPFDQLSREICWLGHLVGWHPRSKVDVGLVVQKCGRTTQYSTGRIIAIGATIDVNFGGNTKARFLDQIITTPMSTGGDSGAVIATLENVAVGMIFACSRLASVANQIQHVRNLLTIEVAPQRPGALLADTRDQVAALNAEQKKIKETQHEMFKADLFDIDLKTSSMHRFLPVSIYHDGPQADEGAIVWAVASALRLVRFDAFLEYPAEQGSILKRFVGRSMAALTDKEVTDRMRKIERAAELQILDRPTASITKEEAEAASALIGAMKDCNNAIQQIGSLLIIKRTHPERGAELFTKSLSRHEQAYLDEHPSLLARPDKILEALQASRNPQASSGPEIEDLRGNE